MNQPYDDQRLASVYHEGNDMPDSLLRAWSEFVLGFAAVRSPRTLDVGSGTGAFSAGLARAGASSVLGIEPSEAMLAEALRRDAPGDVRYASGSAAAIPVADDSVGLALLSRVIHHVPDRPACARELRRALDSSGVVVVRTTFGDRLDAIVYEYWPRLLDVDRHRFPSCDEVVANFEAAGFQTRETTSMAQPVTRSLAEYQDRMTTQPQSKFKYVSSEEFAAGLRRLRDDAASSPVPTPVMERYDVAVFAAV